MKYTENYSSQTHYPWLPLYETKTQGKAGANTSHWMPIYHHVPFANGNSNYSFQSSSMLISFSFSCSPFPSVSPLLPSPIHFASFLFCPYPISYFPTRPRSRLLRPPSPSPKWSWTRRPVRFLTSTIGGKGVVGRVLFSSVEDSVSIVNVVLVL